jgi:hypothetical protein
MKMSKFTTLMAVGLTIAVTLFFVMFFIFLGAEPDLFAGMGRSLTMQLTVELGQLIFGLMGGSALLLAAGTYWSNSGGGGGRSSPGGGAAPPSSPPEPPLSESEFMELSPHKMLWEIYRRQVALEARIDRN